VQRVKVKRAVCSTGWRRRRKRYLARDCNMLINYLPPAHRPGSDILQHLSTVVRLTADGCDGDRRRRQQYRRLSSCRLPL